MKNKKIMIILGFFTCLIIFSILIFSTSYFDIGIFYPLEISMKNNIEKKNFIMKKELKTLPMMVM